MLMARLHMDHQIKCSCQICFSKHSCVMFAVCTHWTHALLNVDACVSVTCQCAWEHGAIWLYLPYKPHRLHVIPPCVCNSTTTLATCTFPLGLSCPRIPTCTGCTCHKLSI